MKSIKRDSVYQNILSEINGFESIEIYGQKTAQQDNNCLEATQVEKELSKTFTYAEEKSITNIVPANTNYRFLKRVINRLIKPYSKQQIDYNIASLEMNRMLIKKISKLTQDLSDCERTIDELNKKINEKSEHTK